MALATNHMIVPQEQEQCLPLLQSWINTPLMTEEFILLLFCQAWEFLHSWFRLGDEKLMGISRIIVSLFNMQLFYLCASYFLTQKESRKPTQNYYRYTWYYSKSTCWPQGVRSRWIDDRCGWLVHGDHEYGRHVHLPAIRFVVKTVVINQCYVLSAFRGELRSPRLFSNLFFKFFSPKSNFIFFPFFSNFHILSLLNFGLQKQFYFPLDM